MSICGYDEEMGKGLQHFAGGLFSAIRVKAAEHRVPMEAQLAAEADQMTVLLDFLERQLASARLPPQGESLTTAFMGIVLLAKGLLGDAADGTSDEGMARTAITQNAKRLISLLQSFEHAYEHQPVSTSYTMRTRRAWEAVAEHIHRSAVGETASVLAVK